MMETEIMYSDWLGISYNPSNLSLSIGENYIASVEGIILNFINFKT